MQLLGGAHYKECADMTALGKRKNGSTKFFHGLTVPSDVSDQDVDLFG